MKSHPQLFGSGQVLDNPGLCDLETEGCQASSGTPEPSATIPSWILSLSSVDYCCTGDILSSQVPGLSSEGLWSQKDINLGPSFPTELWDLEQVIQLL